MPYVLYLLLISFLIFLEIGFAESQLCFIQFSSFQYAKHDFKTKSLFLDSLSSEIEYANVIPTIESSIQDCDKLFQQLEAEHTNCYRIFHGATEGVPGLTIDKYGSQLLIQTFREEPTLESINKIAETTQKVIGQLSTVLWRHRSRGEKVKTLVLGENKQLIGENERGTECGLIYDVSFQLQRRDPLLYLDFRVVRRWLKANSKHKTVLNLFSYTCGASVAALAGGADHVTSVDFSNTALEVGRRNMLLNGYSNENKYEFVCADVLPTIRQYASLPVGGRMQKGKRKPKYVRVPAGKKFDLTILDPPTWAKSSFGAVDIKRDYQTLFKPAVLATKPGGIVIATNHLSTVDREEWVDQLQKCAVKAGRVVQSFEMLDPEDDFPSPDGCHPLKIAVINV